MALTAKQQCFVDEYLVDLNATQAAIRAGYSEKTAKVIGAENLTKPDIAAAIQKAMDERAERTGVTQDRVIAELARVAFLDIRDAFTEDGNLIDIKDMPEDVARAIGGLEVSSIGGEAVVKLSKIKIIDKLKALELLGRNLVMFTDKVDATVEISHEDAIKELA